MGFTPTESIWFNGRLVPWRDAQVHVLAHALHYGTGVFEGIRCYDTKQGPAIFRLREHMQRLINSAKIYRMELPYSVDEFGSTACELVRHNKLNSCYVKPIVLRGYGEVGVSPLNSPIECYMACWSWGVYLGPDALTKGVEVGVSSWTRIAPNTLPAMSKAAANYMNSQLIRMEAQFNNYAEGIALDADGHKHVLGLWIEQTEGAKFWLKVMNDLKTRGLGDILIAVVDGLKGFPEAIGAVFPETLVQTCIVHLIRSSMAFVSWKDRKQIMPDLKAIYRAENAEAALDRLAEFEARWGARYPAVGQSWRRAWEHVVPLFAFPPDIRKMIYTTNAVESLNRSLRKIIKTRGSFPNDEAALKLLYLAIRNAGLRWRRAIEWTKAMGQFAIQFGDRFPGLLTPSRAPHGA
jgi:putative transposase